MLTPSGPREKMKLIRAILTRKEDESPEPESRISKRRHELAHARGAGPR